MVAGMSVQKHPEQVAKLLKDHIEAEWISYPTAERFSGLSHTTLWRLVGRGEIKAARVASPVT